MMIWVINMKGLTKERLNIFTQKRKILNRDCLILITPDSERTMCTFLGIAGKINENDIKIEAIKKSEIIFLKGYLWDEGEPKKHLIKQLATLIKLQCHFLTNFV